MTKTTREHYGAALALLARLYEIAEAREDTVRARLYAIAVDVLLDAWPSDAEADGELPPSSTGAVQPMWPAHEKTLIGLGQVPERLSSPLLQMAN